MRKLQIISISHRSYSSQERLDLQLKNEQLTALFDFIKDQLNVEGYVYLSTCNRIELYFEADGDLRFDVIDKYLSLIENGHAIDKNRIKTYLGSAICMKYLLDLSVGKFSAIQGDDQIYAQLKKSFQASASNRVLSTLLERAFQTIVKSHKQICTETNYCKQTVSLAYHSLKSIYQYIPKNEIGEKEVLIIGAGSMAEQIVKYIDKFGFKSVSISNRTEEKAKALSIGHAIDILPYDVLDTSKFDIIISCTDLGFTKVGNFQDLEYYIDLSMQSNFLDQITIPHILLHELQTYIEKQKQVRFSDLGRVNRLLSEHGQVFISWEYQWRQRQFETSDSI